MYISFHFFRSILPTQQQTEKRKFPELSLRQRQIFSTRTKFLLIDNSEAMAASRLLDQRMKTMTTAIVLRKELGFPFQKEEIPDDLLEKIFENSKISF